MKRMLGWTGLVLVVAGLVATVRFVSAEFDFWQWMKLDAAACGTLAVCLAGYVLGFCSLKTRTGRWAAVIGLPVAMVWVFKVALFLMCQFCLLAAQYEDEFDNYVLNVPAMTRPEASAASGASPLARNQEAIADGLEPMELILQRHFACVRTLECSAVNVLPFRRRLCQGDVRVAFLRRQIGGVGSGGWLEDSLRPRLPTFAPSGLDLSRAGPWGPQAGCPCDSWARPVRAGCPCYVKKPRAPRLYGAVPRTATCCYRVFTRR